MIIELLLDSVYNIFSMLFSGISIPSLPEGVMEKLTLFTTQISEGVGILGMFTHIDYLLTLFQFIIAFEGGILLYKLILWFVKKIPLLNIK